MKNSDKKVIIFLFIMLLTSIAFLAGIYNKPIYKIVYWLTLCIISMVIFGKQRDRTMYKVDFIQITIIYTLCYLIFIYLGGLAFGFSRVPYSLEFIKIIKNIWTPLALILIQEYLRFTLIKDRGHYKSIFILTTLVFFSIELLSNFHNYDLKTALGIFEFVGGLVVPSLTKNILLTYLVSNCGIYPSLIYRIILELYVYIVPIVPNYGIYVNSVLNIVFPTIMYLKFNTFLSKQQYQAKKQKRPWRLLYIPLSGALILAVLLVSGFFKYSALAIGSGSMKPTLGVGDVVVMEKLDQENIEVVKTGDILIYTHDSKIIIHRVIKIKKVLGEIIFRTKGDNNPVEDDYNISESDVLGVVRFKIPYIGYPSVWLNEKIK